MSTQNVKILLRRGLRSQLTNTKLATGEMGFTTDTNQLFVGIDPSVNEIQFDPFVNAHAVIQSWLESSDNPFPGLEVDEDLVIRNIPNRDSDGNEIDGVDVILKAMQFFIQTIVLTDSTALVTSDELFQYRFIYGNDVVDNENLEAGSTYRILDTDGDNSEFFNSITGADRVWAKYDNVTIRDDYENDVTPSGSPMLIKVIDVRYHTHGKVITKTDPNIFAVEVSEGLPYFIQDAPNNENYYHFNGNEDNILTSDFGLFKYDGSVWAKQDVIIIDEVNDGDKIETYDFDGVELDKPKDTYGTNGDYAVVTKSSKIAYWHKVNDSWEVLGADKVNSVVLGHDELIENTATQTIPDSIMEIVALYPDGRFVIELDENFDADAESWVEVTADINLNDSTITIDKELDCIEDQLKISYYYNNDFQFSSNPPVEFTNQDGTYSPPTVRSTGDALQADDHYVYTDKDIGTGLKLNMFKWSSADGRHVHTPTPFYITDEIAQENAPNSVLVYARPYGSHAILELRQRDYATSEMWYPFDNSDVLSYYFSKNNTPKVNDEDSMYAISVSGDYDFPAAFYGRARTNVEVVTENSFNQLFADQHLTSQDEYTGIRPSLFKKVLPNSEGVFLKYDKNICTTFFIDYSLKQSKDDVTFLRVGQLKVINGYPHGIEKIKLTDENTEIWQDDNDGVADRDEFSNVSFSTAIQDIDPNPAIEVDGKNIFIMYTQELGWNTEISYTVKRWTM